MNLIRILLKIIASSLLFTTFAFADIHTTDSATTTFGLPFVTRGQRGWDERMNLGLVTLDTVLTVISNDVSAGAAGVTSVTEGVPGPLAISTKSQKVAVSIISADASTDGYIDSTQYEKVTILSSDVGRISGTVVILSSDVGMLKITQGIISSDVGVIEIKVAGVSNDVAVISSDILVMKLLDTIISNDAVWWKSVIDGSESISADAVSADVLWVRGIPYPLDSPADNDVVKYDSALGTLNYEADAGGATYWSRSGTVVTPATAGDSVSVDTAGTLIVSGDVIFKGTKYPTDAPADNEIIKYDTALGRLNFEADSGAGGGTGFIVLPVQSAKLQDSDGHGPRIDGGNDRWMLTYGGLGQGGSAQWQFRLPTSYSSAPKLKIGHSLSADTSGNVEYEVYIAAITSGDSVEVDAPQFDTANTNSITVPGTAGFYQEVEVTLTNFDSGAAGDLMIIAVSRDADDGSNDTATNWSEVRTMQLEWTE